MSSDESDNSKKIDKLVAAIDAGDETGMTQLVASTRCQAYLRYQKQSWQLYSGVVLSGAPQHNPLQRLRAFIAS